MKTFKLIVHQKNWRTEEVLINAKDFPDIKEGDIVEIYHPEDEYSRLLLQITLKEDLQSRDAISVEQSIVLIFQLRIYSGVIVNKVNPETVALDSVELTFKDQYMGRSEMWRLKNSLVNTCVYINKKIEFCGGCVRCQVYEMWSQGDRVACGVITDDTKVVFRSSTSMVYLFIQMSSEMWDFDIHGDLYFEKAVNGFLADLFQKWKKNGSNHEVTIVLFSRTFYKANCVEEFPQYMRECLQIDYKGRFYEDFYRVAVQNERYDDWTSTLVQLRRLFTDYLKIVLEYHKRPGEHIPKAVNSTAAQGNFLEVLNMSLNVFEKHYLDRSFDRTGQLSVVITPGVGVFEVDRELTNVTKQRIIDNGVGSDLVCVGEQPLHAVPLLKFHNKDSSINVADDYSMPHWINLSFYSTNKKVAYSTFIPRIKLPPRRTKLPVTSLTLQSSNKAKLEIEDECMPNSLFDYDAYDAQVFQLPQPSSARFTRGATRNTVRVKKTSVCTIMDRNESQRPQLPRKMSDPDLRHSSTGISNIASEVPLRSDAITIPALQKIESPRHINSINQVHHENSPGGGQPHQAATHLPRPGRALINPFDPSHVTIKLTSNRRRWTHIFPKGPTGVLIQQHHYQAVPTASGENSISDDRSTSPTAVGNSTNETEVLTRPRTSGLTTGRKLALLWGATGEQEWTPALTTGVDWKSLTIPACLPITTDYFPDKRSLQNDYVVSDYNLLPDDVNADYAQQRAVYKKPLTSDEVFRELISQRLAQGFQLIVAPNTDSSKNTGTISSVVDPIPQSQEPSEAYILSIGRLFHRISLTKGSAISGPTITVTRYRPRHPYPPFKIHYEYRFHAPHHDTYEISRVSFTTEKLETFNWNYLDHYICTRGDTDFTLAESQKYWRFRMYLLPLVHPATRKILDGAEQCDIYTLPSTEEQSQLTEYYLRFIESWVNKIRLHQNKKSRAAALAPPLPATQHDTRRRHSTSILQNNFVLSTNFQASAVGNSPFRERLGSNRITEKPRPRSGSKVMERVKAEGAGSGKVPPASEASSGNESRLPLGQTALQGSTPDLVHSTDFPDTSSDDSQGLIEPHRPRSFATLNEILEAICHLQFGVNFVANHTSLPSFTFVSTAAVQWIYLHVEGVIKESQAVSILENMLKEELICHASGDFKHPFIVGFYLYHVVYQKDLHKDIDYVQPLGDLASFQNEWLEVEILHPTGWRPPFSQSPLNKSNSSTSNNESLLPESNSLLNSSLTNPDTSLPLSNPTSPSLTTGNDSSTQSSSPLNTSYYSTGPKVPPFLRDHLEEICEEAAEDENTMYKHTHLEIDVGGKSDRVEWGHCRYQSLYKPDRAYEMVVQWVTASGSIVAELILGWFRKAQSCGFQLLPIPADPLALPTALKSDPLRAPVFVPLHTQCLLDRRRFLFEEFSEDSWAQRLFLFQEAIVERFGFLRCTVENPRPFRTTNIHDKSASLTAHHHQYVHLTGNAFILIPSQPCQRPHIRSNSVSQQMRPGPGRHYPVHREVTASPHEEYITRHVSGRGGSDYRPETRMGFLWSWNHMVIRRWKTSTTPATGDEHFQTKILKDFKDFCSNNDNRLKSFWDSCWVLKQTA